MSSIESFILNSEKLTRTFGYWPSFHDAEVIDLHLWRGNVDPEQGKWEFPVLTMKIHLWEMTKEVNSEGYFVLRYHTLCTLRFRDVQNFHMSHFNFQNAMMELLITRKEREKPPSPYFVVEISPAHGIETSFECLHIEVIEAVSCTDDGAAAS